MVMLDHFDDHGKHIARIRIKPGDKIDTYIGGKPVSKLPVVKVNKKTVIVRYENRDVKRHIDKHYVELSE